MQESSRFLTNIESICIDTKGLPGGGAILKTLGNRLKTPELILPPAIPGQEIVSAIRHCTNLRQLNIGRFSPTHLMDTSIWETVGRTLEILSVEQAKKVAESCVNVRVFNMNANLCDYLKVLGEQLETVRFNDVHQNSEEQD